MELTRLAFQLLFWPVPSPIRFSDPARIAQGVTVSEAVLRLSQRFGLSQRQSYRYVQNARAMEQPAEPSEALIPITIKIPGTLAANLRAHARSSGHSIGEIVARALRRLFSHAGRHG